MIRKISDIVMSYVSSLGVKHVFMLPGGGSMHLVDSLGRSEELTYVVNLHEQGCAIAADAYGQFTNELGVALVTTGPGGTNTLTGVAAAWLDSTPCLFISGQVKREDLKGTSGVRQLGFQEIDIVEMVRSITKYAVTVTDPRDTLFHLQKAVHAARSGRPGPVWVDIPLDVQGALLDESELRSFEASASSRSPELRGQVAEVITLLNAAKRPAVLIGNGVRLADAGTEIDDLIEVLGVPVLTTWKALDLVPDEHPLFAGRPGAVAQRGANFVQQTADLLLVLGARLDLGQTAYNHKNFAPRARKVIVDVDGSEIDKLRMSIDVRVQADAGDFVLEMLRQKQHLDPIDRSAWVQRSQTWRRDYPVVLDEYWSYDDGVSLYVLVDVLSDLLEDGDLFVPGSSGACSEVSMQAFRAKRGVRVLNSQGIGSMGMAIPAVIGACLAAGQRRTISIDGDGGFWMNIQELETVRRLNLPAKFFVLNNDGYGSIKATQNSHFAGFMVGSGPTSGLTLPDIRRVSSAFGIETSQLRDHINIREHISSILSSPGPSVCEVMVSPRQATAPRVSSQRLPDGRMVSKPMEDLWPPLEASTLAQILREAESNGDDGQ